MGLGVFINSLNEVIDKIIDEMVIPRLFATV